MWKPERVKKGGRSLLLGMCCPFALWANIYVKQVVGCWKKRNALSQSHPGELLCTDVWDVCMSPGSGLRHALNSDRFSTLSGRSLISPLQSRCERLCTFSTNSPSHVSWPRDSKRRFHMMFTPGPSKNMEMFSFCAKYVSKTWINIKTICTMTLTLDWLSSTNKPALPTSEQSHKFDEWVQEKNNHWNLTTDISYFGQPTSFKELVLVVSKSLFFYCYHFLQPVNPSHWLRASQKQLCTHLFHQVKEVPSSCYERATTGESMLRALTLRLFCWFSQSAH